MPGKYLFGILLGILFVLSVSVVSLEAQQPQTPQEGQRAERGSSPLEIPKECIDGVSEDTGKPVMFPRRGPLIWGLSTKDAVVGEEIPVLLWIYNAGDQPQQVATCGDIDEFWISGIDVFDSSGELVARPSDLRRKQSEDHHSLKERQFLQCVSVCYRNFPIPIPPRTCMHGSFSRPTRDFSRNLRDYYELAQGDYVIVPGERGEDCMPVNRALKNPNVGLKLRVRQK